MTDEQIKAVRDLAHWTAVRLLAEREGDPVAEADARIQQQRIEDAMRAERQRRENGDENPG